MKKADAISCGAMVCYYAEKVIYGDIYIYIYIYILFYVYTLQRRI